MFSCSPDLHTVKLFCLLFNFYILLSNFCWSLTEIQTDCHWWRWSYVDSHICNESSDDAGCWNQTHSSVTSPKQIIVSQIEMQLCFCIKGPFPVIKPSEFHLPGTGFLFLRRQQSEDLSISFETRCFRWGWCMEVKIQHQPTCLAPVH